MRDSRKGEFEEGRHGGQHTGCNDEESSGGLVPILERAHGRGTEYGIVTAEPEHSDSGPL